jgi:hypothetical protein
MSRRPNTLQGPLDRLDPDPVGILLGVLGTVAGIVIPLAREAWWSAPPRLRARITTSAGRLSDEQRHMDVDLAILEELVAENDASSLPFQLGTQLYLSNEWFRRYREVAERLASSAARSVRRIHEIEGSLRPEVFDPDDTLDPD